MNYDFLQSYNIPVARQGNTNTQYDPTNNLTMEGAYGTYSMHTPAQSTPAINTAYYGYADPNTYTADGYQSTAAAVTGSSSNYYQNPERFTAPSKHGSGYVPHKGPFKRKSNSAAGGSSAKKDIPQAEMSTNGKSVIFLGRDESYPEDLNALIHPLSCDLCNVKMTSRLLANDHYESKAHDKHISAWLFKNYTEKGTNPPLIKRFLNEDPIGSGTNLCCEDCALKLNREHCKCQINTVVSGVDKMEAPIAQVKLEMTLGRDKSYPEELNSLIHPLSCDVCNKQMNSKMMAKDHYASIAHDNNLTTWLFKNYTEKGINPPSIKRFIKQGPAGPDAFYCEACDLKLTSLTHANQHYGGKKHRSVIAQRSKPSGAGFYNAEGKWVRTGTKAMAVKQSKDGRFGIGDEFKYADVLAAKRSFDNNADTTTTTTSAADTTTNTNESEVKLPIGKETTKPAAVTSSNDQDPALFCSICKVSVTSAVQMTTHLVGSKHTKKLKLAGINPTSTSDNMNAAQSAIVPLPVTLSDNVLLSAIKEEIKPDPTDLSMYRTPSGQYYCKICNTSMPHLPGLEQHLKGKRHLKRQTEEKALAALANKKLK